MRKLWEFSVEVERAKGNSEKLNVCSAHFLPHDNSGACFYIETHAPAILFRGAHVAGSMCSVLSLLFLFNHISAKAKIEAVLYSCTWLACNSSIFLCGESAHWPGWWTQCLNVSLLSLALTPPFFFPSWLSWTCCELSCVGWRTFCRVFPLENCLCLWCGAALVRVAVDSLWSRGAEVHRADSLWQQTQTDHCKSHCKHIIAHMSANIHTEKRWINTITHTKIQKYYSTSWPVDHTSSDVQVETFVADPLISGLKQMNSSFWYWWSKKDYK